MADRSARAPSPPAWREVRPGRGPPEVPVYFDRAIGLVRLDQNTNPRGNPVVAKAGMVASRAELHRYGTARGSRLRRALSERYGLPEEQLLVGNGSDELLHTVARAFLGPGRRAALLRPGYDPYAMVALWAGATVRELPVDPFAAPPSTDPFGGDLPPGFLRGIHVLFHSTPQNPVGSRIGPEQLGRWARELEGGCLVADEAYGEYAVKEPGAPGALWPEGLRRKNVLFTRTFSKAWGLAGLRVGWGVGSPEVVQRLEAYSLPYTLDTFAEELAIEALGDDAFLRESVELVRRERPRLGRGLEERGFRVLPSEANFVLTDPPVEGEALWSALRSRSVLLRRIRFAPQGRVLLRATVGLPEEHERLFTALDAVLPRVRAWATRRSR